MYSESCIQLEIVSRLSANKVLVCCGPGNNGGDGLVCARHLSLLGYQPLVYYPKRTDKELYKNLTHQCSSMGISLLNECPEDSKGLGLIVDALFGFSFKPPVRPNFESIMNLMRTATIPIAR